MKITIHSPWYPCGERLQQFITLWNDTLVAIVDDKVYAKVPGGEWILTKPNTDFIYAVCDRSSANNEPAQPME